MNKKGGYQIIDLKDINLIPKSISLSQSSQKVILCTFKTNEEANKYFKNLFNKNTKTILFSNIVINRVEKNDVFYEYNYKNAENNEYDYYFNIYNYICELWVNENKIQFNFDLDL